MQRNPSHQIDRSFVLKAVLIAVTVLAPFIIYFDTVHSIVAIWNRSETFTHQYIILPISLWLIWQRRQFLRQMTIEPYWPALIPLAICGFVWLLANMADVQVVKQFAFVAMLVLSVVTVLGQRIASSIAFPLCFLVLAIPVGEFLIEPLIGVTADFTVNALQWTGIPVLREGNSFLIPTGRWSVIQACSGIRYLIASVTLGCLYAYLNYQSRIRQAAFVVVSIIVPIIANGMRAYMIVMIGHLSGMRLAVGIDHIIYGWLFFGLVMLLMFWIGGYWREGPTEVATAAPQSTTSSAKLPKQAASTRAMLACTLSIIACVALWPILAYQLEHAQFNPAHADLSELHANWQEGQAFTTWKPSFYPSDAELYRFFRQDSQVVGLSIHYYRNQHSGSTLISSANRMLAEEDPIWNRLTNTVRHEAISGRNLAIREETIQNGAASLLIWHWYWIDGQLTENDYVGKLLQAKEALLLRGDDGAALAIFAPYTGNPDAARSALRSFISANLPPVEATLAKNGKP